MKAFLKVLLRSNVLQFDGGMLRGLCGGRLLGPSMLRDMIELRNEAWLSLALIVVTCDEDGCCCCCGCVDIPLLISVNEFG